MLCVFLYTFAQNVGPNHILPALGLATLLQGAPKGTTIIDIGTGGGFPGLPLAIACPQAKLLLIDSVGKKVSYVILVLQAAQCVSSRTDASVSLSHILLQIQAVTDMAERLGLTNVVTRHGRVEEVILSALCAFSKPPFISHVDAFDLPHGR